jgi:hypothetical protein
MAGPRQFHDPVRVRRIAQARLAHGVHRPIEVREAGLHRHAGEFEPGERLVGERDVVAKVDLPGPTPLTLEAAGQYRFEHGPRFGVAIQPHEQSALVMPDRVQIALGTLILGGFACQGLANQDGLLELDQRFALAC